MMRAAIRPVLLAMILVIPSDVACQSERGDRLEDPSFAITQEAEVKPIATFEDRNPFSGGVLVTAGAPEGRRALRVDRSYVSLDRPQDWLGYDFLKADLDSAAAQPMSLTIEIRDADTKDYWTRVNY